MIINYKWILYYIILIINDITNNLKLMINIMFCYNYIL